MHLTCFSRKRHRVPWCSTGGRLKVGKVNTGDREVRIGAPMTRSKRNRAAGELDLPSRTSIATTNAARNRKDWYSEDDYPWMKPGLSRPERVIVFVESLKVTSGADVGKSLRLRDWQKEFIRRIYAEDPGTD